MASPSILNNGDLLGGLVFLISANSFLPSSEPIFISTFKKDSLRPSLYSFYLNGSDVVNISVKLFAVYNATSFPP